MTALHCAIDAGDGSAEDAQRALACVDFLLCHGAAPNAGAARAELACGPARRTSSIRFMW